MGCPKDRHSRSETQPPGPAGWRRLVQLDVSMDRFAAKDLSILRGALRLMLMRQADDEMTEIAERADRAVSTDRRGAGGRGSGPFTPAFAAGASAVGDRRPVLTRRAWLVVFAGWMAWGLLAVVEQAMRFWWMHLPIDVGSILLYKLPLAVALAVLTPAIMALSRRYPVLGSGNRKHALLHAAACFTLITAVDALSCLVAVVTAGASFSLGPFSSYVTRVFAFWLLPIGLLYWLIVVVDEGVRQYLAARDNAETAAQLAAQLAQARLEALKLELHPHFLFNALNSVASLIRTGRSDDAVRVTAGLGGLLRRVLADTPLQEVPLRDELQFIRDYVDIELIRFSDRLAVVYDIAPGVDDAMVPHLFLQPIVENALRHGLHSRPDGGTLTIGARRDDDRLTVFVTDDGHGVGAQSDRSGDTGIGLANVRARLETLYGREQSVAITSRDGAGTRVVVTIPFHTRSAVTVESGR
jgi:two-component system LytT family sensor kinase